MRCSWFTIVASEKIARRRRDRPIDWLQSRRLASPSPSPTPLFCKGRKPDCPEFFNPHYRKAANEAWRVIEAQFAVANQTTTCIAHNTRVVL